MCFRPRSPLPEVHKPRSGSSSPRPVLSRSHPDEDDGVDDDDHDDDDDDGDGGDDDDDDGDDDGNRDGDCDDVEDGDDGGGDVGDDDDEVWARLFFGLGDNRGAHFDSSDHILLFADNGIRFTS